MLSERVRAEHIQAEGRHSLTAEGRHSLTAEGRHSLTAEGRHSLTAESRHSLTDERPSSTEGHISEGHISPAMLNTHSPGITMCTSQADTLFHYYLILLT